MKTYNRKRKHIKQSKQEKQMSKRTNKNKNNKTKRNKKMKGGTINPFSDFFGVFNTMSYNLSNALSTFSINAPPAYLNSSENPVNPSYSKQFLSSKQ